MSANLVGCSFCFVFFVFVSAPSVHSSCVPPSLRPPCSRPSLAPSARRHRSCPCAPLQPFTWREGWRTEPLSRLPHGPDQTHSSSVIVSVCASACTHRRVYCAVPRVCSLFRSFSIPLTFVSMDGARWQAEGVQGETLLDTIRRADVPVPGQHNTRRAQGSGGRRRARERHERRRRGEESGGRGAAESAAPSDRPPARFPLRHCSPFVLRPARFSVCCSFPNWGRVNERDGACTVW